MDKNTMIFTTIAFVTIAALIGVTILFFNQSLTGAAIADNKYSFTKAICNETNYCQDYEIICEGSETIEVSLIENSGRQYPASWKDTRTDEQKNKQCE